MFHIEKSHIHSTGFQSLVNEIILSTTSPSHIGIVVFMYLILWTAKIRIFGCFYQSVLRYAKTVHL